MICEPSSVSDGAGDEARVAVVDAGQDVVEADRGSAGDAGGQEEHPALPSAGEQGDAVADAGFDGDEAAGEVAAVQPAATARGLVQAVSASLIVT